jgi:hypothetical protein
MTSDHTRDPYEVLGISPTATNAEIRRARRELLKGGAHPDTADQRDVADVTARTQVSMEINRAYADLMHRSRKIPRTGHSGAPVPPETAGSPSWADVTSDDHRQHLNRQRLTTVNGVLDFLRLDRLGQWLAALGLTVAGVPLGIVAEPYAEWDLAIWALIVLVLQAALARRLHHTPLWDVGHVVQVALRLAMKAQRAFASLIALF